jgi:hypothetical protein
VHVIDADKMARGHLPGTDAAVVGAFPAAWSPPTDDRPPRAQRHRIRDDARPARLNALVHPLIRIEISRRIAAARRATPIGSRRPYPRGRLAPAHRSRVARVGAARAAIEQVTASRA